MIRALTLLIAIAPGLVIACPAKLQPSLDNLSRYSVVVLGRVEHVEVLERANSHPLEQHVVVRDRGPDYEAEILVDRTFDGRHQKHLRVTAGGCGVRYPEPGEIGIFFVEESGRAIPLYESEGEIFQYWLHVAEAERASN